MNLRDRHGDNIRDRHDDNIRDGHDDNIRDGYDNNIRDGNDEIPLESGVPEQEVAVQLHHGSHCAFKLEHHRDATDA